MLIYIVPENCYYNELLLQCTTKVIFRESALNFTNLLADSGRHGFLKVTNLLMLKESIGELN